MRNKPKYKEHYLREPLPPTRLPYRICTLGMIRNSPFHSTLGTYNNDAMLMLFMGGRGVYTRHGQSVDVHGGMVGLVLPGGNTGLLAADPSSPYEHFYCRFSGAEAMATARRIAALNEHRPFFTTPHWGKCADGFRLLLAQRHTLHKVSTERMRPADALLAYVLALLESPGDPGEGRISAAKLQQYMEDHLAEPVDLDRMSRHFSVSKPHLCRAARQALDDTVLRVWQRMKMRWAQTLLRESSFSVAEVAKRVGFSDPLYFSKVFKSYTGRTPTQWRSGAALPE